MDKFVTTKKNNDAIECICSSESEEERGGKKSKTTISSVWKYFTRSSDKKFAKCVKCSKEYKTSGNTSNLRDHLKRMHPNLKSDEEEPTSSSTSSSARSSIRSVSSHFKRVFEYDVSSKRKKEIDQALAELITHGFQSFNIVEDESFRNFVKVMDPRYILPSKNTIKNVYVTGMYSEGKTKLQKILDTPEFLALTTDCWTSVANEAYLTITCHFVDENFIMRSAVLETKNLNEVMNHNAQNIANTISGALTDWNISKKISCIVTDNAKSMINACNLLNIPHLPCFSHTLNLVVQDGLMLKIDKSNLKTLITKCKNIVHYFKSSTIANEKLKEAQNTSTPLKLIQEVPTRWNSTYLMLERLLHLIESVNQVLLKAEKTSLLLSGGEKKTIWEVLKLLEPFNDATKRCCGNDVTISLLVPIVNGLHQKIYEVKAQIETEIALTLCTKLIESMSNRLFQYETDKLAALGSLLDPRFKRDGFMLGIHANKSLSMLDEELTDNLCKQPVENFSADQAKSSQKSSNQSSLLSFITKKNMDKLRSRNTDAIMLRRQYMERENLDEDKNPLEYCKIAENEFAPLKNLAVKYLCIPATSTESERIFSKAGLLISEKRSRLKEKNVNMLIFLNKNKWIK